MKKALILTLTSALLLLVGSGWIILRQRSENRRLADNNRTLTERLSHTTALANSQRLSIGRLRMTIGELEELRPTHAHRIERLGISLRNTRSLSLTATHTLLDTLLPPPPSPERLSDSITSAIHWSDEWVNLTLTPHPDGTHLQFVSHATLTQVVHRIPYKWWIFRWGTKALRQEIRSSNPHTKLVFSEYIEIEK